MAGQIPHAYFEKVKRYFGGDIDRTWTWFKSPNPNLGMMSPIDAIRDRRMDKVKKTIDNGLRNYNL